MIDMQNKELPDYYGCVAEDVLQMCKPKDGVWVDLGCGPGQVSCALATLQKSSTFVLIDPDPNALDHARRNTQKLNNKHQFQFLKGKAESIPLPSASVALVVSRGSVFFWENQADGIREIYRVLQSGGVAMIGGGLGSTYPLWARKEFIRRRRESAKKNGKTAMAAFKAARSPDTFKMWADQAGLSEFKIIGEGGLSENDPETGLGIWLIFRKGL